VRTQCIRLQSFHAPTEVERVKEHYRNKRALAELRRLGMSTWNPKELLGITSDVDSIDSDASFTSTNSTTSATSTSYHRNPSGTLGQIPCSTERVTNTRTLHSAGQPRLRGSQQRKCHLAWSRRGSLREFVSLAADGSANILDNFAAAGDHKMLMQRPPARPSTAICSTALRSTAQVVATSDPSGRCDNLQALPLLHGMRPIPFLEPAPGAQVRTESSRLQSCSPSGARMGGRHKPSAMLRADMLAKRRVVLRTRTLAGRCMPASAEPEAVDAQFSSCDVAHTRRTQRSTAGTHISAVVCTIAAIDMVHAPNILEEVGDLNGGMHAKGWDAQKHGSAENMSDAVATVAMGTPFSLTGGGQAGEGARVPAPGDASIEHVAMSCGEGGGMTRVSELEEVMRAAKPHTAVEMTADTRKSTATLEEAAMWPARKRLAVSLEPSASTHAAVTPTAVTSQLYSTSGATGTAVCCHKVGADGPIHVRRGERISIRERQRNELVAQTATEGSGQLPRACRGGVHPSSAYVMPLEKALVKVSVSRHSRGSSAGGGAPQTVEVHRDGYEAESADTLKDSIDVGGDRSAGQGGVVESELPEDSQRLIDRAADLLSRTHILMDAASITTACV
jgi:hypothetical protein